MFPSTVRGSPPVPSAVVFLHRSIDEIGDGAPNDGAAFIGPPHLPPARSTLAWLVRHGYAIRLSYFADESAARAAHPTISFDVGDFVREEGAAIFPANPSILAGILSPQVKSSGGTPPAPFSLMRCRSSAIDESTPFSTAFAGGNIHDIVLPPPEDDIIPKNNIPSSLPSPTFCGGVSHPRGSGGGIFAAVAATTDGTISHPTKDPPSSDDVAFGAGAGVGVFEAGSGAVGPFGPRPRTGAAVDGGGRLRFASLASNTRSVHSAAIPGGVGVGFHPPPHLLGGTTQSARGSSHFASPPLPLQRTCAPMELDALMADDLRLPPLLHHGGLSWYSAPPPFGAPPSSVSLHPASASVSGLVTVSSASASTPSSFTPPSSGGGGGGGGDGDSGGSMDASSSTPASSGGGGGSGVGDTVVSMEVSSSSKPPIPSSYTMSEADELDAAKALAKAMEVFHGGSKADKEWPTFWSRISSIMRFSHYSPHGPLTTTYGPDGNAANSNRLYILLTLKVGSPALEPFFNNPKFEGKGFEMLARLKQTYAPSETSQVVSRHLAVIIHTPEYVRRYSDCMYVL